MPTEADFERERIFYALVREAADELIAVVDEMRYGYDVLDHVESAVQAAAERAGLLGGTPPAERPRKRKKLPSRAVWDRDGWQCVTCGSHVNLTVDHIVPWSKGGSDDLDNLQTLCGSCNSRKGDRE